MLLTPRFSILFGCGLSLLVVCLDRDDIPNVWSAASVSDTIPTSPDGGSQFPDSAADDGATSQATASPADDSMLWQILEVRQKQGDLLHGTMFGDMPPAQANQLFLEALKHVAAIHEAPPATIIGHPNSARTDACEVAYARRIQQEHFPEGTIAQAPVPLDSDDDLVRSLRQASRQLSAKADELEDREDYEQGDRLRQLADELRQQARFWSAGAATQTFSDPGSRAPLPPCPQQTR